MIVEFKYLKAIFPKKHTYNPNSVGLAITYINQKDFLKVKPK